MHDKHAGVDTRELTPAPNARHTLYILWGSDHVWFTTSISAMMISNLGPHNPPRHGDLVTTLTPLQVTQCQARVLLSTRWYTGVRILFGGAGGLHQPRQRRSQAEAGARASRAETVDTWTQCTVDTHPTRSLTTKSQHPAIPVCSGQRVYLVLSRPCCSELCTLTLLSRDANTGMEHKIKRLVNGKEGIMHIIKKHIEANHITGISIPCDLCGKSCKSRNGLAKHKSKYHRSDQWTLYLSISKPCLNLDKKKWLNFASSFSS